MFFTLTFPNKVLYETKSKEPESFSLPSCKVEFYIRHLRDWPPASALLQLPIGPLSWMVLPREGADCTGLSWAVPPCSFQAGPRPQREFTCPHFRVQVRTSEASLISPWMSPLPFWIVPTGLQLYHDNGCLSQPTSPFPKECVVLVSPSSLPAIPVSSALPSSPHRQRPRPSLLTAPPLVLRSTSLWFPVFLTRCSSSS